MNLTQQIVIHKISCHMVLIQQTDSHKMSCRMSLTL